jgi:hypothetical protein
MNISAGSSSDAVREQATHKYVETARRKGLDTFSINGGDVQRDSKLRNRVFLVCMALKSKKFLQANGLRLVSKSGPPSGFSTTVTYTYEFIGKKTSPPGPDDPWNRLRGALKDIFVELGDSENYLRKEREQFYAAGDEK